MEGLDLFGNLHEGCVSHVLSFTSPRDACRSSAVCSVFQSALESDALWERFLPSDYPVILAGAVSPVELTPKKELFFRLCDHPVLIDDGKMSFSIEKTTGRKCYMLSARKLRIIWVDAPRYWKWTSLPESRFQEVAQLLSVCWLEITGRIDTRILSPKTAYKAYLVFKYSEDAYGLDIYHAETSVTLGAHASNRIAFLQENENPRPHHLNVVDRRDGWAPQERIDGWMEIEMGEFFSGEGDEGEAEMSLKEVKGLNWKSGLIIQGVEIRPA